MDRKRKVVGLTVAIAIVVSIVTVTVPAEKKDERIERQFERVYKIYKEQYGEIPKEKLEKISKEEFIKAYVEGFRGSVSSKKNAGTRSCVYGDLGAELRWYKPPMSLDIHHWARAAADAYQLCDHITTGGDVRGATIFVYENTETNTGFAAAEGDGWGHLHPKHWYEAWNDAYAIFCVDGDTEWDYETVSGPEGPLW